MIDKVIYLRGKQHLLVPVLQDIGLAHNGSAQILKVKLFEELLGLSFSYKFAINCLDNPSLGHIDENFVISYEVYGLDIGLEGRVHQRQLSIGRGRLQLKLEVILKP